jgi:hypothetical protein
MASLDMPWWFVLLVPSKLWALIYFIGLATVSAVSAWILRVRMQRRIKNDLGRKAGEDDLTSIETWMKVDEVEEKSGKDPNRTWVPKSIVLVPTREIPDDEKPIDLFPKK